MGDCFSLYDIPYLSANTAIEIENLMVNDEEPLSSLDKLTKTLDSILKKEGFEENPVNVSLFHGIFSTYNPNVKLKTIDDLKTEYLKVTRELKKELQNKLQKKLKRMAEN